MRKTLLFPLVLLFSLAANAQYHNVYKAKAQWSAVYDFNQKDDVLGSKGCLVLDDSDNIYIGGHSTIDTISDPGFTYMKYGPDGKFIWRYLDTIFANAVLSSSAVSGLVWDSAADRLFVCGYSSQGNLGGVGLTSEFDINTVRASDSGAGNFFWPPANVSSAQGLALCHSKNGNVYGTGYWQDSKGANALSTVAIASSKSGLNSTWVTEYDSVTYLDGEGQYITTDNGASPNIYVCGLRRDSVPKHTTLNTSLACIKYNNSGNIVWSRIFANPDTLLATEATGVAVDKGGNVYMSGIIPNKFGNLDGIILKYNSNGKMVWQNRMSSQLLHTQNAAFNAINLDNNGNIIGAGYIETDSGDFAAVVKYDSTGKVLWHDTIAYSLNGFVSSHAVAMTLDDTGNVYITGDVDDISISYIFAARYSATGAKQWFTIYPEKKATQDLGIAVKLDKQGNVIIAGQHDGGAATGQDMMLVKYSQEMSKVKDTTKNGVQYANEVSNGFMLFPNPCSNNLKMALNLAGSAEVIISITDITGRQVLSQNLGTFPAGQQNATLDMAGLTPGMYMYHCTMNMVGSIYNYNGKLVKE